MIDKGYIDLGKLLHGSFNMGVAILFLYQGRLGWKLRRERRAGGKRDFSIIKRHRTAGPLFGLLGILGFVAGAMLVYIDKGHLIEYPLHLMTGSFLALCIVATFVVSTRIKGPASPWRSLHFLIGVLVLLLYIVQMATGLDILL